MNFYKIRILLLIFLFFESVLSFSQIQRNTGQITGGVYAGGTIEAFTSVVESFPNDNYLYPEWYYGSINLKGSDKVDVREIPIKINVVRNTLEFRHQNVVKEIDLSLINSFRLLIPNQLNPAEFVNFEGKDGPITYKVNYLGKQFSSFIYYTYNIIPADYNAQFDTGSKVDRVQIVEKYYLRDESDSSLTEVKLSKKGLRNYFERNEKAYKYIQKNKPSPDTEYDLYQLMVKVNELK